MRIIGVLFVALFCGQFEKQSNLHTFSIEIVPAVLVLGNDEIASYQNVGSFLFLLKGCTNLDFCNY